MSHAASYYQEYLSETLLFVSQLRRYTGVAGRVLSIFRRGTSPDVCRLVSFSGKALSTSTSGGSGEGAIGFVPEGRGVRKLQLEFIAAPIFFRPASYRTRRDGRQLHIIAVLYSAAVQIVTSALSPAQLDH